MKQRKNILIVSQEKRAQITVNEEWILKWKKFFNPLTPYEVMLFIWHITVPFNVWTLDIILSIQKNIIDTRKRRFKKYSLPKGLPIIYLSEKERLSITEHHIIPRSRGGSNKRQNIIGIDNAFHKLWHSVFLNLTPEEAIQMTNTYKSDILKHMNHEEHHDTITWPHYYEEKPHLRKINTGIHLT